MDKAPAWRFRRMHPDEKEIEPTHREHLAPRGVFEPLVREAIQNSLDGTPEGRTTKVQFTLGEADGAECQPFFASLRPHLEAIAPSLPDGVPTPEAPIRFLTIEDYNTRGLEGDPDPRGDDFRSRNNHFRRFWHTVGQSAGDVKRRGSWGVGKVVFANASGIRTFFGVTLRAGDSGPLLMGESGLTIHSLPGERDVCAWYGYFATHVESDRRSLALPAQDQRTLDAFCGPFCVDRHSPGLSIVIPYLRDDSTQVTLDDLAAAVIDQYFVPILAGRLEVSLRNGLRNLEIDRFSIEARLAAINWPPRRQLPSAKEMLALLRLAKRYLDMQGSDYHQVPLVGEQTKYRLTDARIQDLSSTFFRGDPIAIEIPVEVRPKNAPVASEKVRVILERDEDLRKGNVRHLRSGIEISKLRENGGPAVRGLVVVGSDFGAQGELDRLLQASEGPAHITWEDRGEGLDRAKMAFIDPGKPIRFMRHVANKIVEQLSAPTDERDISTLAPFFPDMDGESRSSGQSPGASEKTTVGKKPTPQVPVVPSGTIEGIVQAFGSSQNLAPVDGAQVVVTQGDASIASATTLANGRFTFRDNVAGDYKVTATKELIGSASSRASLHGNQGVHLSLLLRPERPPRMFSRVALSDGVAIRGNRLYTGPLRTIRLQFAYASWGGANRFDEADFSLADLPKSSDGVRESLSEMVVAPNVLQFTPLESDFSVEVRGFDPNRAIDVRVRAVGDEVGEDSDE